MYILSKVFGLKQKILAFIEDFNAKHERNFASLITFFLRQQSWKFERENQREEVIYVTSIWAIEVFTKQRYDRFPKSTTRLALNTCWEHSRGNKALVRITSFCHIHTYMFQVMFSGKLS